MVLGIFSWLKIVLSSQIMFFVFFDDFLAQFLTSFHRVMLAFALNPCFSTTTAIRSSLVPKRAAIYRCSSAVRISCYCKQLTSKPREFYKLYAKDMGEDPIWENCPGPVRFL